MSEECLFAEPKWVKVKLPVVLAEEEVQVTIDNTTCLPELAQKIDKIDAKVRDVEVEPVFIYERPCKCDIEFFDNCHYYIEKNYNTRVVKVKTLTIQGTLHKQIYYVNKDNDVRHFAEDIPFATSVNLNEKFLVLDDDEVYATILKATVDMQWQMVKASQVHQTGVVTVKVKLVEDRQLYVWASPGPEPKPPRVNLIKDPSFEAWAGDLVPIFWGGSNISRTTEAYKGPFAAELGRFAPDDPGSLFQHIDRNLDKRQQYKFTFHARENVMGGNVSNFKLDASIIFLDKNGNPVETITEIVSSNQIPDNMYGQFSIPHVNVPLGASSASVSFNFIPEADNTNAVKIDDVVFICNNPG